MKNSLFDYYFDAVGIDGDAGDKSLLVVGAYQFRAAQKFKTVTSFQYQKYGANSWLDLPAEEQKKFPTGEYYDVACVSITKSKEESIESLKLALHALKPQGQLIAIGANDANGKRIEKWMNELGMETNSLSKDKHRIVYGTKTAHESDYSPEYDLKLLEFAEGDFITIPGIYGWNKIDIGSDLLTEFLPDDLKGTGADFGCGYGFLSKYILKNSTDITKLDLIDADYRCLVAAEKNMQGYQGGAALDYRWLDITQEKIAPNDYDFIIMNPPFHEGKKAESAIGIKFIETASRSLKNKGALYIVANRHLPYEDSLKHNFSSVEKLAEEEGFKIFKAVK